MNFKAIKLAAVMAGVSGLALLSGCTEAEKARRNAYNDDQNAKIDVYSGGKLVASYVSTGKVQGEAGSGYYFKDKVSGELIEVNGDVIITYNWKGEPALLPDAKPSDPKPAAPKP